MNYIYALGITITIAISFWTDRTLDFWCTYFAGHEVNVPWWLSFLVTILANAVIFSVNVITEVIRLFLS